MVNEKYLKYRYEIGLLSEKIYNLLDELPYDHKDRTFEENEIYSALYKLNEALSDAVSSIDYYTRETKEGKLRKMDNGKFELISSSGKRIDYFSCGNYIEVHLNGKWYFGRIEYRFPRDADRGGYYFFNKAAGNPFLIDGMRARIRV